MKLKPLCKADKIIGDYIQNHATYDFCNILSNDERLEVAEYLSELSNGLFGWYPFNVESTILQVGSWFGAFTEMLSFRCKKVTVIEPDPYRAYMTKKRLKDITNVRVINKNIIDYCKDCNEKFGYILFAVDESVDIIPDVDAYTDILRALKRTLNNSGKLLFAVPNRFGIKYFCGVPDPNTKLPFDGMTEHNSKLYRFDRKELLDFMKSFEFTNIKLYYPMPDHHLTQLIYTDERRPDSAMLERLHIYAGYKTQRVLDEWILSGRLTENNVMYYFSNSFLLEAGNTPCSDVIYSALSVERDRSRAFATNIYNNNIVEKVPIYPEGTEGIKHLLDNTRELSNRGIPVLEMQEKNGKALMEHVYYPSLSSYLKDIVVENRNKFIKYIDKLSEYIYASSEHVAPEKNYMRELESKADWGVILEKAYIEMIPVNSFYDDGKILFYDQEFTKDNCPAGYVLFRALRDIYAFSPEIEKYIPLEFMKERYGLVPVWDFYAEEEEKFQTELRRRNIYSGFFCWIKHLFDTAQENRRYLLMPERKEPDYFNVISNLDGRRIVLFGSGKIAEDYLNKYGDCYSPIFIVDNNTDKWGSFKCGIKIKDPNEITKLMDGTYQVIIAIKDYKPVVSQLQKMGVGKESYRIYSREIDGLIDKKLKDVIDEGKYYIGYTAGIFDQFNIVHLSFLKKCKLYSHYLVVGVYTDELLMERENKKSKIPFEERLEIVRQCKYVDKAISIDVHNNDEIRLWRELKFGCLFVDENYEKRMDGIWLRRKLRALGSEVRVLCK